MGTHCTDGNQPKEMETEPSHELPMRKNTEWGSVFTDLNNVVLPTDIKRMFSRLLKINSDMKYMYM